MADTTLFYAIIGVEGVFPVDIARKKLVGHVKKSIKKDAKSGLKGIDPHNLQLILAWDGRSWLKSESGNVKQLRQGETTSVIDALSQTNKPLVETDTLEKVLEGTASLASDQFHVLVTIVSQTKLK
ncbi:hypothetical protein JG687_00018296 [Phytophthora cactorum]|uniref:Crinkler effector protein N-terminal domain-containing protein n=1 Tax=Phytophthora cactorum TaxID=29920 RepID=A0A329RSP2_9STRA|nr:hypothetical protein Pcac1_g23725 [Phytophthora cactorum]KAG2791648.1 hypothetical protein PC111_g23825 [Phytophthora cactorum]KAG2799795.1 hypothetical protein PC112_g20746 [Phytophthora cactorum]KAG2811154.1 hypothetical protein PC113_g23692 [Phytophthora cactorum]KAG2872099.1 hypothetical protein PC114_g26564 [Phytophthora cactorum]